MPDRSDFAGRRSVARARFRSCAKASLCRRRAGGCSCSRASRTIFCLAPPRCAARRASRVCSNASMASSRNWRRGELSMGLPPTVVESMYETFGRLRREGLTILLAEQSIELALEVSDFAAVLQVGKSVLSGTAAALAEDPQVQKAYLGG